MTRPHAYLRPDEQRDIAKTGHRSLEPRKLDAGLIAVEWEVPDCADPGVPHTVTATPQHDESGRHYIGIAAAGEERAYLLPDTAVKFALDLLDTARYYQRHPYRRGSQR